MLRKGIRSVYFRSPRADDNMLPRLPAQFYDLVIQVAIVRRGRSGRYGPSLSPENWRRE
jgi:hypothetical protein